MRVLMASGVACLVLAACDSGKPVPVEEAAAPSPAATEFTAVAPAAETCDDITALVNAASEREPFASLRTGKFTLGDRELDDKFTTSVSPGGAKCEIGNVDGFGPDAGKVHVVNCTLFTSGMLDREKNAEKAKVVFDSARALFQRCLPTGWVARDGASIDPNANETMIYETQEDSQRAMTASYYTYPVQLRKTWEDGSTTGRMSGWYVTLDFQKDGQ